MHSRRRFLKQTAATLPAGAAGLFLATGSDTAAAEVETVANIVGDLPSNIIYTRAHQGVWKGKAGSHVPQVSVAGDHGHIVTKHGMSPQHYIVRHTLICPKGEVVFGHTFAYDDNVAESEFDGSKIEKGKVYYALSFCNKHDLWLAEVKL
ncbi:MAG: hypothetical protein ACC645_00415 [Pirellulales bacterium]